MNDQSKPTKRILAVAGALVAATTVSYSIGTQHGFASGLETGLQFVQVHHALSVIESQYHGQFGVY